MQWGQHGQLCWPIREGSVQMWRSRQIGNSLFGRITDDCGKVIQKQLFLDEADRIVAAHNRTVEEGCMSEWISVKDELPEHGWHVFFSTDWMPKVYIGRYDGVGRWFSYTKQEFFPEATHWCLLHVPDPPRRPDVGSVNVGGVKLPDAFEDLQNRLANCELVNERLGDDISAIEEKLCELEKSTKIRLRGFQVSREGDCASQHLVNSSIAEKLDKLEHQFRNHQHQYSMSDQNEVHVYPRTGTPLRMDED
jgi:hypothetical protein